MQHQADYESLIAVFLSLISLTSLIWAALTTKRLSDKQEHRLTWLKQTRIITWGVLAASQAALISFTTMHHGETALQELAASASWLIAFSILLISHKHQGSFLLLPSCLSLLQAASLLITSQEAALPVLVHSLQAILILVLLVLLELVVSHHVVMAMEAGDHNVFEAKEKEKKKKDTSTGANSRWKMAFSAFKYIVPADTDQALRMAACFGLLGIERVVNLAVPILFKHMIDRLSPDGSLRRNLLLEASLWDAFFPSVYLYLLALFVKGGAEGMLSNLRDIVFIPLNQGSFRRVSLDVFGHLLDLDHTFHAKRKTGQVMRILDRGTSSIQDITTIALFNVLPQLLDVAGACTYLALMMNGPWIAIIVFLTIGTYIPLTLLITERRGAIRKTMNALDNQREGRAMDVLLNYDTVKLFAAEEHELKAYDRSIKAYQAAEYWQLAFVSTLSILQSSIIWAGTGAGISVCVKGLVEKSMTLGDLVLFLTIIQQLYLPISQFGSFYRSIQKALIDLENMFDLLETRPKISDPSLQTHLLVSSAASVRFDRAEFSYKTSGPAVLRSVSFDLKAGKKLAIVGSTGSGKSTILKLLLRFYDVTSGSVSINGQNVRSMTIRSLRQAIGVVPQDVCLFNASIADNIKYGQMDASEEEVIEASKLAALYDSILRFKKGFRTIVGERGVRLSGGEKQRVGLARAIIKKPAIMVLDEATSSVDTITEQHIQASLSHTECTGITVAHRLSTIIDADVILVLDKGEVAQYGSHYDLMEDDHGLYFSLWRHQMDHIDARVSPEVRGYRGGGSEDDGESTDCWAGAVGDSDYEGPSSSALPPHLNPRGSSIPAASSRTGNRAKASSRLQNLEELREPLLHTEEV
jgi:ATP-binding cassette subfamily B (MDR/TAP) protein 6